MIYCFYMMFRQFGTKLRNRPIHVRLVQEFAPVRCVSVHHVRIGHAYLQIYRWGHLKNGLVY